MFIIFYVFPSALTGLWFNYVANTESHGSPGDGIVGIGGNGISNQLPGNNGEEFRGQSRVLRINVFPIFSRHDRRKDDGGRTWT